MKWILLPAVVSCIVGCTQTTEVIDYRTVAVTPSRSVPVLTQYVTPMVQPVVVDYVEPLDVTTTSIDFY